MYVFPCNLHYVGVGLAVNGIIAYSTAYLYWSAESLCFEKCKYVHADIRFLKILAMQTAACDTVAHITAELAVRSTTVNITAAYPVTEGIDLSRRIDFS